MALTEDEISFQPDDTTTPAPTPSPDATAPATASSEGPPDALADDGESTSDQVQQFLNAFGIQYGVRAPDMSLPGMVAPLRGMFDQSNGNWPSGQLAAWQKELVLAGLIGPKTKVRPGLPDAATAAATSRVFAFMKLSGITDPYKAVKLLQQASVEVGGDSGGGGGGSGRRRAPKEGTPEYRDAYMNTAQQLSGWLGGMG